MERLKKSLSVFSKDPKAAWKLLVWEAMKTQTRLKKIEEAMDKKMSKVTKQMKTAERDIKKGKKASAVKALKSAEKKNVKLTKIDREVRDPMIDKCKKMMKKRK